MTYRTGSHSTYDLKYHIIWCTKYRYRVLTNEVGYRVRELIREICAANYVNIISGSMSPDHIHLLVSVPPNISLSKLLQYIKGRNGVKKRCQSTTEKRCQSTTVNTLYLANS